MDGSDVEEALARAVEAGVLVDVTSTARESNYNHPTYISPALRDRLRGMSERLLPAILKDCGVCWIWARDRKFGTHSVGLRVDTKKRDWAKKACPGGYVWANLAILPSSSGGVVVVLVDGLKDFILQRSSCWLM